ncbi:flavin reductase (DIM6/NTAB) family NADH-FMN oxidoreductase RutF [Hydrogenispora ethanolica]|uniref:Flavin reductase (DIM6/NTAB) family NADH-FMN oxidoreductase RutF n=1 Tax=Hydrogenispora ethanolica TaxID=1082276 RepID=A0A4R1R2X6_HYDET|nr:flavin reductase family protein [Hydrogenispora ethanolica]TCL59756.1 flavin reductase (DIM6/NTAB) family NADH-FMN oxidoreductase RutF [Hydrogenispora ethanolica]
MKTELGPTDIFFPVPAALIVSGTIEHPNIATIAWAGMVSSTPPTVGVSFDQRRYSLDLIRKTKEFTLNIPRAEHYRETDYCGLVSGRKTKKFETTGFTAIPGRQIQTPIIKECPFNLECRVTGEVELGDYRLVLGKVVNTRIDSDKVRIVDNRPMIDIVQVNPLVYCATIREYWNLGGKLGDAFKAGKELLSQNREG